MHLSITQWLVAGFSTAVQVLILAAMIKRKLRSSFPIFFNFIAFGCSTMVLLLLLGSHLSNAQYFFVFWSVVVVSMVLSFGVMYEVFVNILKPYPALLDFGKLIFRWAVLFLCLASFVTALVTSGSQASKICSAIQQFQLSVQLMQCGLLLLFLLFEKRLGFSWKNPAIAFAIGMGVFAALDLSTAYMKSHFPQWSSSLELGDNILALATQVAWISCIWACQPRKELVDSPTRLVLQRWNEVLLSSPLVSQGSVRELAFSPVDSFIPGVEKTVERVLSRKMAAS